jgi:hypothetical protein
MVIYFQPVHFIYYQIDRYQLMMSATPHRSFEIVKYTCQLSQEKSNVEKT